MLKKGVQFLTGIGPHRAAVLSAEAGIDTIEDLLYYIPRRYVDRSSFKKIGECLPGETVTVAGTVTGIHLTGKNRRFLQITLSDDTASLRGVFFGGQRYFQSVFHDGDYILFSGKVEEYRGKQIVHPDYDFLELDSQIQSIHTGRIVPLYPSTAKLKSSGFDSRGFRRIIRTVIDDYVDQIQDSLDPSVLKKYGLPPLKESLISLHFPETFEDAETARRRLAFNEMFFLQLYLSLSRRYIRDNHPRRARPLNISVVDEFIDSLPFILTGDQKDVIQEILKDLSSPFPMNRMLQGDVGSGKTVVAMAVSLAATARGEQTAVMAPTEILTQQHFNSFSKSMPDGIRIKLITGSMPKKDREEVLASIARGEADIIIGTHALIQDKVEFMNLGLVIIDEQHRFGVQQRSRLREKGNAPDLLIMTATPIPRSLSLTLYGDLDISLIREKPSNRIPIKTISFPESRLSGVHNSIRKYVLEGRQVYIVLPLIEESEKIDLRSAQQTFKVLNEDVFPELSVDLLHGKMKTQEKELIMKRFVMKETDILVTTTVIEVGVDVPNATIIVLMHAERFGLSQLHQIRGRVGRGEKQSFCILIYPDDCDRENLKRLDVLLTTDDGFRISEEDLKLRGSGEFIGTRQHGYSSGFEFTDLVRDLEIINITREEAKRYVDGIEDIEGKLEEVTDTGKFGYLLKGIRQKRILGLLA